jgi:hypothetical protein
MNPLTIPALDRAGVLADPAEVPLRPELLGADPLGAGSAGADAPQRPRPLFHRHPGWCLGQVILVCQAMRSAVSYANRLSGVAYSLTRVRTIRSLTEWLARG